MSEALAYNGHELGIEVMDEVAEDHAPQVLAMCDPDANEDDDATNA